MTDLQTEREAGNRKLIAIAVISTMTGVSALFVVARLFVRVRLMKTIGLDDYLLAFALICGCLNVGFTSVAVTHGIGQHFDTLTPDEQMGAIKWTFVAFIPGINSFAVPKLAVVALLARLLMPSKRHLWFLWASSSLTVLSLYGCIVILYAQCSPARSQWDLSVPGECWSKDVLVNYTIGAGSLSAAMDLYLAVYPAVVLFRLQMQLRKKVALSLALGAGGIAAVVAAYKCSRLPSLSSPDFTWKTYDLVLWTCIEGCMIIIAACIPVLQPLARLVADSSVFSYPSQSSWSRRKPPYESNLHGNDIPLGSGIERSRRARAGRNAVLGRAQRDISEESILREDTSMPPKGSTKTVDQAGRPEYITRVDEVTVANEPEEPGTQRASNLERWYLR